MESLSNFFLNNENYKGKTESLQLIQIITRYTNSSTRRNFSAFQTCSKKYVPLKPIQLENQENYL